MTRRRMDPKVSCLLLVVTAALWLWSAPPASAAGLDVPWSGSGDGTTTVESDGTETDPKFSYSDDSGSTGIDHTWEFTTTAGTTRTVGVGWRWQGFHAFFAVTAGLQRFVQRDGAEIFTDTIFYYGPVNCCDSPSNGFDYLGTTSFDVEAGDVYGFRLLGSNEDGNSTLQGVLDLTSADASPPEITPHVSGTAGSAGFYTGPVTVTWDANDPDSEVQSTTGCEGTVVSEDTAGKDLTCSATSGGGTANVKVTIKKDSTAPNLTVPAVEVQAATGADGASVGFTATATDAVDPAPSVGCSPASGTKFAVGTTHVTCTARDAAGNTAGKSFDVIVLPQATASGPAPGGATSTPAATTLKRSSAVLLYRYKYKGSITRLFQLKLTGLEPKLTIIVACKGPGCPAALKGKGVTKGNTASSLNLVKFVRRPLKAGSKLVVTLSGGSIITTIKTLTMVKGKAPKIATTCLKAGATKPTSC
jgi:HYR domain-containing protein